MIYKWLKIHNGQYSNKYLREFILWFTGAERVVVYPIDQSIKMESATNLKWVVIPKSREY